MKITNRFLQDRHPKIEFRWVDTGIDPIGIHVRVPQQWSDDAAFVYGSKYMSKTSGGDIEKDVDRIVDAIAHHGSTHSYFEEHKDTENFKKELKIALLMQYASFNSPVWFNVGVVDNPQASACFILHIEDDMKSILNFQHIESQIFKSGSGTGFNCSALRGEGEALSGGGVSSGPMAFIKGQDAYAGVIKSGGKLRRAAKLVCMDVDHPDIQKFVSAKIQEELKARALIEAGYSKGMEGEAYKTVAYQNINFSVRVTDEFMQAALEDKMWQLKERKAPVIKAIVPAKELLHSVAEAAWFCGDPGIMFHDTTNGWHTVPKAGPINSSNPCGEFVFIDNSACNLASINVDKAIIWHEDADEARDGDYVIFDHLVELFIIAMDILVDMASYPTEEIRANSVKYRPLGLGITNVAATLMKHGFPYNRSTALMGAICSRMTALAYLTSYLLSAELGTNIPEDNMPALQKVFSNHRAAISSPEIRRCWNLLMEKANIAAVSHLHLPKMPRNAQVTLLAPTGTISLLMDCESTGIEPIYEEEYDKQCIGGSVIKMRPKCVEIARSRFPYALQTAIGMHALDPTDHLKMMAACQKSISGAISKTVNLPQSASVDDIFRIYFKAWELGLKSVTVYRDKSKAYQPLGEKAKEEKTVIKLSEKAFGKVAELVLNPPEPTEALRNLMQEKVMCAPYRQRLPKTRNSITHKFQVGAFEGYITAGMYEDKRLGEVFISVSKEGSTIGGMMNAFATVVSMALQYGVPLDAIAEKMVHQRFEPAGFTGDKDIPVATSLVDYIFRWLLKEFGGKQEDEAKRDDTDVDVHSDGAVRDTDNSGNRLVQTDSGTPDAPFCAECGAQMRRQGTCFLCIKCGNSGGCS
jgi:ribonucleoside-diphosphate reductase alpha chain